MFIAHSFPHIWHQNKPGIFLCSPMWPEHLEECQEHTALNRTCVQTGAVSSLLPAAGDQSAASTPRPPGLCVFGCRSGRLNKLFPDPELCDPHTTRALWPLQIPGAAEAGLCLCQSSFSRPCTSGTPKNKTVTLCTSGQHKPIVPRGNSETAAQRKMQGGPTERG